MQFGISAVPVVRTDRRQRSTSQYMQSYRGPGKNVDGRGDYFMIMKNIKKHHPTNKPDF